MHPDDFMKVDRTAVSIARLSDPPDDAAYWLSRSPLDRLEAVEMWRQLNYGYDPATARVQRVLEVTRRPPR